MNLSNEAKLISGITLLTIPTIQLGGTFLLSILSGRHQELTEFQRAMFRAGHAHAGVLVILCLVAQLYLDTARFSSPIIWALRIAFVAGAILISGGFFGAAGGKGVTSPGPLITVLWLGVAVEALAVIGTGIGLLRART